MKLMEDHSIYGITPQWVDASYKPTAITGGPTNSGFFGWYNESI